MVRAVLVQVSIKRQVWAAIEIQTRSGAGSRIEVDASPGNKNHKQGSLESKPHWATVLTPRAC
jgi:hypothetical protein